MSQARAPPFFGTQDAVAAGKSDGENSEEGLGFDSDDLDFEPTPTSRLASSSSGAFSSGKRDRSVQQSSESDPVSPLKPSGSAKKIHISLSPRPTRLHF